MMKFNKKPLVFIVLLLVIVGIGTTFALFYSNVVIPNQFKTRIYDVKIEEEFYDTWGTKKVSFVNNEDGVDVIIRYNYNEVWKDTSNNLLDANPGGVGVIKTWVNNGTTTSTQPGYLGYHDGWCYLEKVVKGGDTLQILDSIQLTGGSIASSSNSSLYKDYSLIFNYEAIQATPNAVKDIWGKDIEINGDDITWE